jgi:hypothetical protein
VLLLLALVFLVVALLVRLLSASNLPQTWPWVVLLLALA